MDVKRVPELAPGIRAGEGGSLVIGATTTMTQLAAHPLIRRDLAALAEGAAVVGSVQIRNRATLAGNLCNASPAADTAPALLVHGAVVVATGPSGDRRIPLDEFFVRSGVTALGPAELVTAIEIPAPVSRIASAHQRRTRRRGHDLASVTVACGVDARGVVRVAYGSVGPRPLLRVDDHRDPRRPERDGRGPRRRPRGALRRRDALGDVDARGTRVPARDAPRPRPARARDAPSAGSHGGGRRDRDARDRAHGQRRAARRRGRAAPHAARGRCATTSP